MVSIFTKIINGEIPCFKLSEDDRFLSFLDIRPIAKGHALVIPKQEIDYIFDLDNNLLGDMMCFSKSVAKAIETVIPCKRIGVMVAGLEVAHAHIHLVPIQSIKDLNFAHAKPGNMNELKSLADEIVARMS